MFKTLFNILKKAYQNIYFFERILLITHSIKFLVIPSRHLKTLFILKKFQKISKNLNIIFFLDDGCLLGAVRQGSFAGRPKDIDIGTTVLHRDKIIKNLDYIMSHFLCTQPFKEIKRSKKYYLSKYKDQLSFRFEGILFQINFYIFDKKKQIWFKKNVVDKKKYFIKKKNLTPLKKICVYKIFTFKIPKNPNDYLKQRYGINWRNIVNTNESKNYIFNS